MKLNHLISLTGYGLRTILFSLRRPILGTIIVTDYCNLHCRHCAVANINNIMYPYDDICAEMVRLFREGIRILFLSGGETMLWRDGDRDITSLIARAREIGFFIITVVTNGTVRVDIPEADLVLLSLDGLRETHNLIRGDTFDTIMHNVAAAGDTNICIYSAINALNFREVRALGDLVRDNPHLNSISFNVHTPYPGTEDLCLSEAAKKEAVDEIRALIREGYPVFNLESTLYRFLKNDWPRPCPQCTVSEAGRRYVCGRCSEVPGLCEQCGFLFALEFVTIFSGNVKAILEMLRVYTRYV